jgi:hypothetical protein
MTVHRRTSAWNLRAHPGFSSLIIILVAWGCLGFSAGAEPVGFSNSIYAETWPGLGPSKVSSVDAVQPGTTWSFWAYAQGFFTGYYQLSATCQDTTPQAYFFSEDAYLNDLAVSTTDTATMFAAGKGGVYKSTNGGQTWSIASSGLPDVDGEYEVFNTSNLNYRANMNCLFSRAQYGLPFDTIWVGTDFGPFWSTTNGDSFTRRESGMDSSITGIKKPVVYDILGHPTIKPTLWAGTIDGVYMTRNKNNWKRLRGLPPGEGVWAVVPAYAVAYQDSLVFTATSKGVFYGDTRVLGTANNSEILASWKPLGGLVGFERDTTKPLNPDTLWLRLDDSTSLNLSLAAGQFVTLVDTVSGLYWSAAVDLDLQGLFTRVVDTQIFNYPDSASAPVVNYTHYASSLAVPEVSYDQLPLTNLIAYGYSQIPGNTLLTESSGGVTTVWLGGTGITSYTLTGDISQRYSASQESEASSHGSFSVYKIAKRNADYFIATDMGLFKAADPHGAWTRLTGYIPNNTANDSVNVETRTVAFGVGSRVYTGGHFGGFQRSQNGNPGSFASSNQGLIYRNGTAAQIDSLALYFGSKTPANPTKGICETVQDWWGDLPSSNSTLDIDDDGHVTILLMDIDDQYHLSTGDNTYINGYYDIHNEYSQLYFTQSNQQEMFYLDTEPQWIHNAGPAACNQMFNLINANYDFQEEEWLREGMASFSQYVAGYPLVSGNISFPMLNSLINWGDKDRNVEHLYSFLLVLYLYEQEFPDTVINSQVVHRLEQLAISSYQGVSGLGRLIHEQHFGTSSNNMDYTSDFAAVFNDFIMAGALDISDTTFQQGRYGFKAVNTVVNTKDNINWHFDISIPPFKYQLPFWSGRVSQVLDTSFFNTAYPIKTIMLNGDNTNQFNFKLLYSTLPNFTPEMPASAVTVVDVLLDSLTQKSRVDLDSNLWMLGNNTPPNIMRLVSVSTSNSGEASTCFTFSDDTLAPDSVYLSISQNPIDNSYLDVYVFSGERMFPDGGLIYQVDILGASELEGPRVDITGGIATNTGLDTTITLDQNIFYANPQASDFAYHIAYHLDGINFPANLHFLGYGEDAAGNEKQSGSISAAVDFVQGVNGGYLSEASSGTYLSIPPSAMTQNGYVLLSVSPLPPAMTQGPAVVHTIAGLGDPSHDPIGPIVSAGSPGTALSAPVELVIPYNPELAGSREIGVYRAEAGSWVYVGGVPEMGSQSLRTYSWKFGRFQVFAGPHTNMTPEMPYKFNLSQNFPNPFNPSTQVRFMITQAQRVRVDVYNLQGQRVARLADGFYPAGPHVLTWTPNQMASGVYFLRLEAPEGTLYRKMMFLK